MRKARVFRALAWLSLFGLLLLGCPNPFSAKLPDKRPQRTADASSREVSSSTANAALLASTASSGLPAGMQVMHFEQNLDSDLGPAQFVPYVFEGTTYAYYSDAFKRYGQYSITGIDDSSISLLQRPSSLPGVQSQGYVAMPQKDFHCAFWLFVPSAGPSKSLVLQTFMKNIGFPVYYHVLLNIHTQTDSGQISLGLTVQKREDYGSTQDRGGQRVCRSPSRRAVVAPARVLV